MNRPGRVFGALALLAATAINAFADPVLPTAANPEEVGLSSGRLARIEAVTQKHIDAGLALGAVMLCNQFRAMVQSAILN